MDNHDGLHVYVAEIKGLTGQLLIVAEDINSAVKRLAQVADIEPRDDIIIPKRFSGMVITIGGKDA